MVDPRLRTGGFCSEWATFEPEICQARYAGKLRKVRLAERREDKSEVENDGGCGLSAVLCILPPGANSRRLESGSTKKTIQSDAPRSQHFYPGGCRRYCGVREPLRRSRHRQANHKNSWNRVWAGDLAYEKGTYEEFENCYQPNWGRFKSRTKPAPGNHEYNGSDASGYFRYWGTQAGDQAKVTTVSN
jgi:hypothetical protein